MRHIPQPPPLRLGPWKTDSLRRSGSKTLRIFEDSEKLDHQVVDPEING